MCLNTGNCLGKVYTDVSVSIGCTGVLLLVHVELAHTYKEFYNFGLEQDMGMGLAPLRSVCQSDEKFSILERDRIWHTKNLGYGLWHMVYIHV